MIGVRFNHKPLRMIRFRIPCGPVRISDTWRTSERANGRTSERANERTGERANERTSEARVRVRAGGRARSDRTPVEFNTYERQQRHPDDRAHVQPVERLDHLPRRIQQPLGALERDRPRKVLPGELGRPRHHDPHDHQQRVDRQRRLENVNQRLCTGRVQPRDGVDGLDGQRCPGPSSPSGELGLGLVPSPEGAVAPGIVHSRGRSCTRRRPRRSRPGDRRHARHP